MKTIKTKKTKTKVCNKKVKRTVEDSYMIELKKQQTDPRHNQSAFKGGR
tara:strand:- start:607 stop:753 length:147 start_codon:yes stop_codon:yes gene_type:complete